MADRTQKLTLFVEINERVLKKSIENSKGLRDSVEGLDTALGAYNKTAKASIGNIRQRFAALELESMSLERQEKALAGVRKENVALDRQREKSIAGIKKETDAIYDELDALRKISGSSGRSPRSVATIGKEADLGRVERGIASVGQLVPGAGGDMLRGLGNVAGAADDIKPLVAEIGKLATAGPIASAAIAKLGLSSTVAAGGVGALGVSLGVVAAAALPVVAAIALVTLAFQKFQKDLAEQKALLDGAISSQRHYYEIIQTGTQESVQGELDAAQVRQKSAQQTRQDLLDIYNNLSLVDQALESIGGANLKKNLEALDAEIQNNEKSINDLTRALDSNEVAARSVTKAQQDAADNLLKETEGLIRATELGATGTREVAEARIAAIQRETEVLKSQLDELEALAKTSKAGEDALAKVNARLADLAQEERLIKDTALPLIGARKSETEAITQTANALRQSTAERQKEMMGSRRTIIQSAVKHRADLLALEKQLATDRIKVNKDAAARIAEIGKQLTDSIAGLENEAQQAEAAGQRQLDAQIAQITQASADRDVAMVRETDNRIAELRERHKRDLERIENDYALAARNARLNRDAVALDAAQRLREDATKEANGELKTAVKQERKAGKERLNEQRKADEQRIRDLRAAAIQETEERRITLQQRIVDLQAAAVAEIDTVRIAKEEALSQLLDRFNQERAQRQAAFNTEQQNLAAHLTQLININLDGLGAISSAWQGFFSGLSSAIGGSSAGVSSGVSSGVGGGGSSTGTRPSFASGVRNFRGGLAMVGERGPELAMLAKGTSVYSNKDTQRILGGMKGSTYNFTINTQSTDAKGILREVKRQMPAIMAQVIEDQL